MLVSANADFSAAMNPERGMDGAIDSTKQCITGIDDHRDVFRQFSVETFKPARDGDLPADSAIQCRDRALIAFTLLTEARDSVTAALKLKHVNFDFEVDRVYVAYTLR